MIFSNHRDGNLYYRKGSGNLRSIIFVGLLSIVIAIVFIATNGNFPAAAALIVIAVVVFATFYRLDWGCMLFVGMVLIFDQSPPRGYGMSIIGIEYFQNLKELNFLSGVDLAVINPLEVQLLLLLSVWILLIALGKKVMLDRVPVWFAALIFFAWLSVSALYGISRGGDFLPALWELRALFYLGIMLFFVPQVIQTRKQLDTLIWICIGAISFKVLQGIVRLARLGFDFGGRNELTSHEDPLFFISLFVLLFGLILFKSTSKQRRVLSWALLPMFIVFFLAQRRAAYAALGVALIAFVILLPRQERLLLVKTVVPVILIFALYLAVFWNVESTIALPAQLVKSSFSSKEEIAGERYYSNLYRDFENYNLAQTVKKSPIIGIGFGNKYDQPISLTAIPFPLRDYIPHNEIYWIAVKAGAIGFLLFWIFLDAYVLQAAFIFSRLNDPYLKAVCAVTIIAILGQIVVSYFDLQLTHYRNMVYLGTIMGLLPTLQRLDAQESVGGHH